MDEQLIEKAARGGVEAVAPGMTWDSIPSPARKYHLKFAAGALSTIEDVAAFLSPEPAKAPGQEAERESLPVAYNAQIVHGMNCPTWKNAQGHEVNSEDCTCGYRFRIHIQTEQNLRAAWMKRAAEAEAELRAQDDQWKTWGIIEIAVRNPNVSSYMNEWESRTAKAEAELATLRAQQPKPRYTPVEVCGFCATRADKIASLEESIATLCAQQTIERCSVCNWELQKHIEEVGGYIPCEYCFLKQEIECLGRERDEAVEKLRAVLSEPVTDAEWEGHSENWMSRDSVLRLMLARLAALAAKKVPTLHDEIVQICIGKRFDEDATLGVIADEVIALFQRRAEGSIK